MKVLGFRDFRDGTTNAETQKEKAIAKAPKEPMHKLKGVKIEDGPAAKMDESSKAMKGKFLNAVAKVEKQSRAAGGLYWDNHHPPKEVAKAKKDHERRVELAKKVYPKYAKQVDENEQIDEVSPNLAIRAAKKAAAKSDDLKKQGPKKRSFKSVLDNYTTSMKKSDQANKFARYASRKMEEESLDEISKELAGRYVQKSMSDAYGKGYNKGIDVFAGIAKRKPEEIAKDDRKTGNRFVGVHRAMKRLTKD